MCDDYFRSRANSVSREQSVRRRSTSKARGAQQQQQRSFGNFADNDDDGLDDVPDPFLAYKSFDSFKKTQDNSYGGGYQAERSQSKVSSSDSSAIKKISESFASSKISDNSYNSKLSSSSGLGESVLDNFDYKFSSAKLSDSSRGSGVFASSTPKYTDTSSTSSSYLSRSALSVNFIKQILQTLSQDGLQLDVQ